MTAAGKSLTCAVIAGIDHCVAAGANATAIGAGVVATVSATVSATGAVNIILNPVVAASSGGGALSVTATGGTITVVQPLSVSSLVCNPTTVVTPGTSNCTATLNAAAPTGGATVTVVSNNPSLSVPSSIVVPAGATSATFTASGATVNANQSSVVTVALNGASQNATLTLTPPAAAPVVPTSLACSPFSLVPGGVSTCTVILSGLAPSGGAAVNLSASGSGLTLPATSTVPGGSSSTTFTATAGSVTASTAVVATAALGGTSVTNSLVLNPASGAVILKVGPGQAYGTPCQALTAAPDGATIQIDAGGSYSGDVCAITANNLTVQGINGRPHINAAGLNAAGKGTWVFEGNDIAVDTVELSGATSTGNQGAGIRMDGQNLMVLNSYLHDNQEGLSTNPQPHSQILVQSTEFNHNGFGDGLTHNVDIYGAARFTVQYSWSHNANAGALVKTQASENYILFNRLTSELGTSSTELDVTNGGRSFVLGNLIEKGPSDGGGNVVGYLLGGTSPSNPSTELYVVNNTLVSDKGTSVVFLNVSASDPTPAFVMNNIFYGAGTISTQASAVLNANLTANPIFVNQAGYDYNLSSGSPAINTGANPGSADGVTLMPAYEYLQPSCGQGRTPVGAPDIGAYEFGGAGAPLYCAHAVAGVTLNPATVPGGTVTTTNFITLSTPAPSTGMVVALASSNPSAAATPASVTVPASSLSAAFSIVTSAVTSSTAVTISASSPGGTQSAVLTVAPTSGLSTLQCSPSSLPSGGQSTCTVTLSGGASGGVTISLSSNNSLLSVPASVTVTAGSTMATFGATVGTVGATQSAVVTATLGGVSRTAGFTLSAPTSLASLLCSPISLHSGGTSTCTVTLTGGAGAGGTTVALSTTNSRLIVPSSVTVPARAVAASFAAHARFIRRGQIALVTAKLGTISKTVSFNLAP